jgi:dihydropteroate synthase
MKKKLLNIKGTLVALDRALIMGILNVTPDSFYAGSRQCDESSVICRIETIIAEGGDMVDLGGYSSRPDAADVSIEEEWSRIEPALKILSKRFASLPVSVDTFRSEIARRAIEEYGAALINDISGGGIDKEMFKTVARLNVPYILMHMRGAPKTMQQYTQYENINEDIMLYFAGKIRELHLLGVNDIIVDPGLGFSKTLEQNYKVMHFLEEYSRLLECPVLVGISRKSMIYKLLDGTPEESLNGTTVLNTFALLNGADILRVHDVRQAVEAVKIVGEIKKY